jgi:HAD superfamily hydrolase (TIGR01509 family)
MVVEILFRRIAMKRSGMEIKLLKRLQQTAGIASKKYMIQTVIFDMDGVIVDTEPVHHYAFHQHFKALKIAVSDEMYASFTGNSTKNVYQKLKESYSLKEEIDHLIDTKRQIFSEAFDKKEDLYLLDGVEDLIKDLHENGIQLILASSSAKVTIDRIFTRFKLYPYFTHIVSGEDFPKSKPHPAIFEHAASLSIAPKTKCIVIEDSTNGIKAAKAAGIFCVGYNSEHSKLQDLSEADVVIQHFTELNFERVKALI